MHPPAARQRGSHQHEHSTTLVCFAAAFVLDGAFAVLQLSAMLMAPAWQGDVYPGSVVAFGLTLALVLVAVTGFSCEWRRVIATERCSTWPWPASCSRPSWWSRRWSLSEPRPGGLGSYATGMHVEAAG